MSARLTQGGDRRSARDERLSFDRDRTAPRDHRPIRMLIVTLVLIAGLLVVALVGFIVLSSTPIFTITSIDAEDTEHLTKENIAKLANIDEGTTLLTIDEAVIEQNLKRNPWVGSVQFVREFPDRLKIIVTERRVDSVVKMSTGSVCWCLGDDMVWIEPINLTVADGQSADDVSLALAQEMGAMLITDVPTSMSPSAGEVATDEVLKAISSYREQFSEGFCQQIVRFSASSVESIACTLSNGVEVSLGAPNNIDIKESLVKEILAKHPNQVTYINVRVPSQPSYRKLDSEAVSEGTGVTVDSFIPQDDAGTTDAVSDSSPETGTDTQDGGDVDDGTSTDGSDAIQGDGQGQMADGSAMGDTSDLILGEDGYYYTYEQYYGLD